MRQGAPHLGLFFGGAGPVEPDSPYGRVGRPALQAAVKPTTCLFESSLPPGQGRPTQPDSVVIRSGSRSRLENGLNLLDGNRIGGVESVMFLDGSDRVIVAPALTHQPTRLVVTPLKLVEVDE